MGDIGSRVGRREKRLGLAVVATAMTLSTVHCGSSTPPEAPPDASPETEASPETGDGGDSCPSHWTEAINRRVIDFTRAPGAPAAPHLADEKTSPYSVFVQGIDTDQGVNSKRYADMIANRIRGQASGGQAQLVLFGRHDALEDAAYLSHLSSLPTDVSLGLFLDSDNPKYQSVEGQLQGLRDFQKKVKAASEHHTIDTLVYPQEGGRLSDGDMKELNRSTLSEGVSLALLGSMGDVTERPAEWQGPYRPMIEAYGLFSHACPSLQEGNREQILVDIPRRDFCDRCTCVPTVSQGIYEACKDAPAQAGRILGYLSSLTHRSRQDATDGVIYLFSLAPDTESPTLSVTGWSRDEQSDFVQAFTEMLTHETSASPISVGISGITNGYWSSQGW